MAHIRHRLGKFTGQIGSVVFVNGEGATDDPEMLAYFAADPDLFDVTPDDDPDPDDPDDTPED